MNKEKKRLAQERRREMRFQEELDDRQLAMGDIRETQNRIGRTATYGRSGEDDGEGIGRRQMTSGEMRLRQEERKRYQFEATESDDEVEDRIDNDLDAVAGVAKNLKALGLAMNSELDSQNNRLDRISDKTDKLGVRVHVNTAKVCVVFCRLLPAAKRCHFSAYSSSKVRKFFRVVSQLV